MMAVDTPPVGFMPSTGGAAFNAAKMLSTPGVASHVVTHMCRVADVESQVFGAIVCPVAIDVMHRLTGPQSSAKDALHNDAVFQRDRNPCTGQGRVIDNHISHSVGEPRLPLAPSPYASIAGRHTFLMQHPEDTRKAIAQGISALLHAQTFVSIQSRYSFSVNTHSSHFMTILPHTR